MSTPCFECESRIINCHTQCEKYKEYAKALKAKNFALKDRLNKEHFVSSYVDKRKQSISQGKRIGARTQRLDVSIIDTTLYQREDNPT